MARVIFLDSGPVGLACGPRKNPDVLRFENWILRLLDDRWTDLVLPEIADYEVRRDLLTLPDSARAIARLDALIRPNRLRYVPIRTSAMRLAASLWADAQMRGYRTAGEDAIDGDVILAAQSLDYIGEGDQLWVVTGNPSHLSRYLGDRAVAWETITS